MYPKQVAEHCWGRNSFLQCFYLWCIAKKYSSQQTESLHSVYISDENSLCTVSSELLACTVPSCCAPRIIQKRDFRVLVAVMWCADAVTLQKRFSGELTWTCMKESSGYNALHKLCLNPLKKQSRFSLFLRLEIKKTMFLSLSLILGSASHDTLLTSQEREHRTKKCRRHAYAGIPAGKGQEIPGSQLLGLAACDN